ncbi:hypothetical protein D1AOALGA4SA_10764 [Olavius algarvensis Delta 1 endosymbiont]|nr:hypothetical protein D1AOALGA4SA_10764 [Olavius algarvensis Delta 1 endosymbiont]
MNRIQSVDHLDVQVGIDPADPGRDQLVAVTVVMPNMAGDLVKLEVIE